MSRALAKTNLADLAVICVCAILFNFLPYFVSGIPLHQQVLSDVESHIAFAQIAMHPGAFSGDTILQEGIAALPASLSAGARVFAWVPQHFAINIFLWSVFVSFCSVVLFVCGIYIAVLSSIQDRLAAFVIAFFCIIPVHALGGSTLGFQALGYLPRDLAIALVILTLPLYFRAVYRESPRLMMLTFFLLGIAANFYITYFANAALTLLFAETIRRRKISFVSALCGALFILGALPTLIEFFSRDAHASPVDAGIMRSYYNYLMAFPFPDALKRYLRRFIIYAVCVLSAYFFIIRKSRKPDQRLIGPWVSLAAASFILSVVGVYIETATIYTKYLLSRASLWFMLSSMVICFFGIRLLMKRACPSRERFFTVLAVSVIFLGQSNAPSIYRFLKNSHDTASRKKDFHVAVSKLKELSREDDIIVAPSTELNDLAATVRAYSQRGIYVCYKYGGTSIMDGATAREWRARYSELETLFANFNSRGLIDFMRRKGIRFAFIPAEYYAGNDDFLRSYVLAHTGHYLIIFRGS